VPLHGNSS
jgi:hypothetical protein